MNSRRLWLAVLGVLLIAFLWVVSARREIAEALIVERARALGVPEVSVAVTSLGPLRATLRDLRVPLGSELPPLEIAEIELHYPPVQLLAGEIARVDVTGLRSSVDVRQGEFDFGLDLGSDPDSDRDPASDTEISRPVEVLNLEDAQLTLLTDEGEWTIHPAIRSAIATDGALDLAIDVDVMAAPAEPALRARTRGRLGRDGRLELGVVECIEVKLPASGLGGPVQLARIDGFCLRGEPMNSLVIADLFDDPGGLEVALKVDPFRLAGHSGEGEAAIPFDLVVPEIGLRYSAGASSASSALRVSTSGVRIGLPGQGLSMEDVAVDLQLEMPGEAGSGAAWPTGSFAIGRIVDQSDPRRFAALSANGRVAVQGERLRIRGDLADEGGLLALHVDALHHPETGAGSLEFGLEPVALDRLDGLSSLFPGVDEEFADASGRIDLRGKASWSDTSLETEMKLELEEFGVTSSWGQFVGVNAAVALHGPDPFHMPEVQRATIERFTAGVDVEACVVDFRLRTDGVVEIPMVRWNFAGGTAQTAGHYDPRAERHEFVVTAIDVDLQTLLELLTVDGLSGEGTLSGEFPVVIHGDVIELREARLTSSSADGWLRYRPEGASAAVAAQDDYLGQFTQLLENFHFESIVIGLNGSVLGDVQTAIHLEGANPDFQDGLPAELNLNVESKFWDLIQNGTAAFRLADQLADVMGRSLSQQKQPRERENEAKPADGQSNE